MFRRLFIANRGEVAVRVIRTCDSLGIDPVLAVSEVDKDAPYVSGRETVCIGGPAPADSYLHTQRLVQSALQSGCTALHPGWGFLAESPSFASLCEAHGVTFVGPPAHVMALMGRKIPAKRAMRAAGLVCIPGSDDVLSDLEHAKRVADSVGYPVLLKANAGGGGRGMRVVRERSQLAAAFTAAEREALACFGDSRLYLEKLVEGGRHIEVQIVGDRYGAAVHFGERDCTVQRNHQKLIEESPSPILSEDKRRWVVEASARAAAAIGYVGAGTMEFLVDGNGELCFMEMNTRLQVEHPVTEMRAGVDLVEVQLRVAAGQPLPWKQDEIQLTGHAVECRINAEDPQRNFLPSPGLIAHWGVPDVDSSVRIDTHVESGYRVPIHYDSLLCKIIAYGDDRDTARHRMLDALSKLRCEGVHTTAAMHAKILASDEFIHNRYDTTAIPGWPTS